MEITSLDNKKIKKYSLLKTNKGRYNHKLFLVEGMHLVEEAYKSGLLEEIILLKDTKLTFDYPKEIIYVNERVFRKLSNLSSLGNVIGICKMLESKEIMGKHLLILDNIADPGNLGTIIRSSKAFNVDTIILSKNSVDIYNDKVLRSTEGMFFHLNIIYDDLERVIPKLKEKGFTILGTDVQNGMDVREMKVKQYALIMGNEGSGVREEIKKMCDENLYIKMNKTCESLNVAVATSILLYELERGSNE